jgi:hypothetical protein
VFNDVNRLIAVYARLPRSDHFQPGLKASSRLGVALNLGNDRLQCVNVLGEHSDYRWDIGQATSQGF